MLGMASKRTVFFKVFRGSMPFHLLMSFYKNYIGVIFYQEWSLTTLVWFLSYIYTRNFFFFILLKRVPWYDWSPKPARNCLLWTRTSKRSAWSGYLWTMSAMKSLRSFRWGDREISLPCLSQFGPIQLF